MIAAVKGKVFRSTPISAVIETASGLFYEINIPITTAEKLPKTGAETMLYTVDIYREDAQALYGFATVSDRDFFKILIEKVSGIGPKTALNMMSRMTSQTLRNAIASGDVAMLSKCPGIGKKTAERLVLELKGTLTGAIGSTTFNGLASEESSALSDAISALIALGLKPADADKFAHAAAAKIGESATTEEIVKSALSK